MAEEEQTKVECVHEEVPAKPPGMIYAIQAGENGPIKFGVTNCKPESRLDGLQTGNHEKLRLISCITAPESGRPSNADIELALHAMCAKYHIRGEWFKPSHRVLGIAHLMGDDHGACHILRLWEQCVSVYAGSVTYPEDIDDMIRWAYRYRPISK